MDRAWMGSNQILPWKCANAQGGAFPQIVETAFVMVKPHAQQVRDLAWRQFALVLAHVVCFVPCSICRALSVQKSKRNVPAMVTAM